MGFLRTIARLSATVATGLLLGHASVAQAQEAMRLAPGGGGGGGPSPGGGLTGVRPAPSFREGGVTFGGSITGRMNLIGPSSTESAPPLSGLSPRAPTLPATVLAPERLDKMDPKLFEGLKLDKLAPTPRSAPTTPSAPAPIQAALPPAATTAPIVKQALSLRATFAERGDAIPGGVKWRVFTDQPDRNGEHLLVAESVDAGPRFELDPGNYIVHAVYGLVSVAKYVSVDPKRPTERDIVLPAGAVRLTALVGGRKADREKITFKLTRDEGGVVRTVVEDARPDALLRLPAGAYHVTSTYGDANSIVDVDLQINAGKLVEAQVHHKAAQVMLKLVDQRGGPELGDTSWTILTPGGDVIRDSIGALPEIVLAEGDYTAIARRYGRMYQQNFVVKAGDDEEVVVLTQ